MDRVQRIRQGHQRTLAACAYAESSNVGAVAGSLGPHKPERGGNRSVGFLRECAMLLMRTGRMTVGRGFLPRNPTPDAGPTCIASSGFFYPGGGSARTFVAASVTNIRELAAAKDEEGHGPLHSLGWVPANNG